MIPAQKTITSGEYLSSENKQSKMGVEINEEIYSLFASKVYNNKIAAVCREYICNAVDSHIEAGKKDTPIDVILPNDMDNVFAVRDYGIGLDEEGVRDVFSTFLKSTKKDKEEPTGFLGIGSKSAFSYAKSFSIIATKNGTKRMFVAFLGEDGVPTLDMLSEVKTDGPNGVEVRVAVQPRDFKEFEQTSLFVSSFTNVPVKMSNGEEIRYPEAREDLNVQGYHYSSLTSMEEGNLSSIYRGKYVGFVMGGVVYPMQEHEIISVLREHEEVETANLVTVLLSGMGQRRLFIDVPLGELEFSFSRENLSMTTETVEAVVYYTVNRLANMVEQINDDIKDCDHVVKAYQRVRESFYKVPVGVFSWAGIDITKARRNFPIYDYMDVSVLRYDRGSIKKSTNFDLINLHDNTTLVVCDVKKSGAIKWTVEMMKKEPEKWAGKTVLVQRKQHSETRTNRILGVTGMDVMYASEIIPEKGPSTNTGVSSRGDHLIRCVSIDVASRRKFKSDVVDITGKSVAYATMESNQSGFNYVLDNGVRSCDYGVFQWMKNHLKLDMIVMINSSNEKKIKKNGIRSLDSIIDEEAKKNLNAYQNAYMKMNMRMSKLRALFESLIPISSKFSFDMTEVKNIYESAIVATITDDVYVLRLVINRHSDKVGDSITHDRTCVEAFLRKAEDIIDEHYPLLNREFRGSVHEVEYVRAVELYRLMEDI